MKLDDVAIKHIFTEHDIAELAREQARALSEVSTLENDLKSVKKDYESRMAAQASKVNSLSTRINSGFEMRTVKCLILDHRLEGYRLLVRTDTGHVVKRRKLDPHELQMNLESEEQPELTSPAVLVIDDNLWPEDSCSVGLTESEWSQLRNLPDVLPQEVKKRR